MSAENNNIVGQEHENIKIVEKIVEKIVHKTPEYIKKAKRDYYYRKRSENLELSRKKHTETQYKYREAHRDEFNKAQRLRRQKKKEDKETLSTSNIEQITDELANLETTS